MQSNTPVVADNRRSLAQPWTVAEKNRRTLARATSEEALQSGVIDAMQQLGWRVAHFRPAKTAKGWRTAVQGDGKGFPDLIAVKGRRCIVAELKSEAGDVTPEQQRWLDDFKASGHEVFVWRPMDWLEDRIMDVLRGAA